MKKVVLGGLAFILAQMAYFVTFSAFYESWFPYYYEDYLTYIYLGGALMLLLVPVIWTFILKHQTASQNSRPYLPSFYSAVIRTSCIAAVVCIIIFIYMLSNSTYIGGSGATVHKIEIVE